MADPEPITDRIRRISAKVHTRALKVGACMIGSDLVAFERDYGITLPEEYREFVLQIGNGAPGPPNYGLIALAEPPPGSGDWKSHTREELTSMQKTFPFTKPWVWEDGGVSEEGTDEQVCDGQLYLGTDGCGMDWTLIITGPERGNIWWRSGEGITPTSPRRDFLRWFEDWLDGVRDWWEAPSPKV